MFVAAGDDRSTLPWLRSSRLVGAGAAGRSATRLTPRGGLDPSGELVDPPTLGLLGTRLGTEPSTITALVDRPKHRLVAWGPTRTAGVAGGCCSRWRATETLAAIDEQAAPRSLCRNLSTAQLDEVEGLMSVTQPGP
jgi:hypothetical protein